METLPKAQRTRGLSSPYQSNFFRSYHKFLRKSWSNIFRISTKHQLQNINQTSAFRQNLNLKILTKPSFRISIKNKLHSHKQASAAKKWPNFSFKILPEDQIQNINQTLKPCPQSLNKYLTLWPNFTFQICSNLFLIININNSNSFNKF